MPQADDPVSEYFTSPDAVIVLRSAEVTPGQAEKATLFRVDSYRLKAFSPVFRDMLQLGEGHPGSRSEPIQLEEKCSTLSILLLLMNDDISKHPFMIYVDGAGALLLDVYKASVKYACGNLQHLLEVYFL